MDILVATKNALTWFEGRRVRIRRGLTTVRAGHPILEGREDVFKPLTVTFDHTAEQATAKSGEVRPTIRPEKAELLARAEAAGADVDPQWRIDKLRRVVEEAEAAKAGDGRPSGD